MIGTFIRIPMKPVPQGATQQDRERMLKESLEMHRRVNGSGGFRDQLLRALGWKSRP